MKKNYTHTHLCVHISIKASKQSKTSIRIRSRIFKYILMHLFLNKTTKAKSNTEPHTRDRILFAIISHPTFMSLRSKSHLNCFFPQYQRGDCITRGFQKLLLPQIPVVIWWSSEHIPTEITLWNYANAKKISFSHLIHQDIGTTSCRWPGIIFTSILSHFGSLPQNFVTFLNKEKLYTR